MQASRAAKITTNGAGSSFSNCLVLDPFPELTSQPCVYDASDSDRDLGGSLPVSVRVVKLLGHNLHTQDR